MFYNSNSEVGVRLFLLTRRKTPTIPQDLCRRCLSYNKSCSQAWETMGLVMEKEQSYRLVLMSDEVMSTTPHNTHAKR